MYIGIRTGQRDSFSLSCSLWGTHTDGRRDGETERRRDRETDTRVKDLLASGVPPKGLEARALTFGGTEGSMLGRRGWFDARSYGWFDFG